MAATIKQTTHEPDQGAAEDMLKKPAALQPPPEESFPEKTPAREGDDDGMEAVGVEAPVVTDAERREQLRIERRKRMAAREAKRAAGEGQGGVSFAEDVKDEDNLFPGAPSTGAYDNSLASTARSLDPSLTEPGTEMGGERSGPLSRTAPAGSLDESTSPKKGQALSKTVGADPETLSRLKQMQMEEEEETLGETAPTGKGGKHRAMGGKGDDVMYSDEEDGLGMSQQELQSKAAQRGEEWSAVFSAVRHGKKNEILTALDRGCPVDFKDDHGNTLLSVAAQNGNKSIIKALLRRGAGLNTQNHKGQTALHFCFTYGYTDLGNYLISKGADDTIENLACLTCYEGLGE